MIHIQVKRNLAVPVEISLLEKAILEALQATNTPVDSGLTLVLSDDHKLRQLNRDFLDIDAPTDVLSFPADLNDPDTLERYLGDIIISVPRAAAQAQQLNSSFEAELILLAVHGTLHLLGYDHASQGDKDKMWSIQNSIVSKLT